MTSDISGGVVNAGTLTAVTVSGGNGNVTNAATVGLLSAGSLTVGGVGAFTTVNGGTLSLNGSTATVGTLNGGLLTLGGSTVLTVSGGDNVGTINGAGSVVKDSGATLT
ncbi:MAG: hypothetical protein EBV15_11595, partial [Bacteroidetes bacterium]|nr:hypothetical protein [Bacteroidota bacterium]